jgi:hypothetical protein
MTRISFIELRVAPTKSLRAALSSQYREIDVGQDHHRGRQALKQYTDSTSTSPGV